MLPFHKPLKVRLPPRTCRTAWSASGPAWWRFLGPDRRRGALGQGLRRVGAGRPACSTDGPARVERGRSEPLLSPGAWELRLEGEKGRADPLRPRRGPGPVGRGARRAGRALPRDVSGRVATLSTDRLHHLSRVGGVGLESNTCSSRSSSVECDAHQCLHRGSCRPLTAARRCRSNRRDPWNFEVLKCAAEARQACLAARLDRQPGDGRPGRAGSPRVPPPRQAAPRAGAHPRPGDAAHDGGLPRRPDHRVPRHHPHARDGVPEPGGSAGRGPRPRGRLGRTRGLQRPGDRGGGEEAPRTAWTRSPSWRAGARQSRSGG